MPHEAWRERETRVPYRARISLCCQRGAAEAQTPGCHSVPSKSDWNARLEIVLLQEDRSARENAREGMARALPDSVLRQPARPLHDPENPAPLAPQGFDAATLCSFVNSANVLPCSASCFSRGAGSQISPCCF